MFVVLHTYIIGMYKGLQFISNDGILYVFFTLQQGHRKDSLIDMFWLMTFFESASLIGSQVLANWLVAANMEKGIVSPSNAAIFLAMIGIIFVSKGRKEIPQTAAIKDYKVSCAHIFSGKTHTLHCINWGEQTNSI